MVKIEIKDILPIPGRKAATAEDVQALAKTIFDPPSDILVDLRDAAPLPINPRAQSRSYEIVQGSGRLAAMLEVNGKAKVRVRGTNEECFVERDQSSDIVRADSPQLPAKRPKPR